VELQTENRKAWFLKPTYGKMSLALLTQTERDKLCANMMVVLNGSTITEMPIFEETKLEKKSSNPIRLRHKRSQNACTEHKRKHQRCPPECPVKRKESRMHPHLEKHIDEDHHPLCVRQHKMDLPNLVSSFHMQQQQQMQQIQRYNQQDTIKNSLKEVEPALSHLISKFLLYENQIEL